MLQGVQALLDQGQDGGQITAQQHGRIQPSRLGRFGQALKIGKDKEYGASVDVSAMSSKEQRGILDSLFVPVKSAWPVPFVVVLDPDPQTALVVSAEQPPRILGPDDVLKFPDLLGEFQVVVRRFFE
jgi:hypothetical protein